MLKFFAVAVLSALAGYGLYAFAQPRVDARTAATPIGTSSSNGVSFAWFYDATDRTVYVCRAGASGGDGVDCRPKTTLP